MSASEASRTEGEVYFKSMIEDVARIPALQVEERLQIELNRVHDALAEQAGVTSSTASSINNLKSQIGVSEAALLASLKDVKWSLEAGIDSRLNTLELAMSSGASELNKTVTQVNVDLNQRITELATELEGQKRWIRYVLWSAWLAGALAATDLLLLLTRG
jgi:hypothetical protein